MAPKSFAAILSKTQRQKELSQIKTKGSRTRPLFVFFWHELNAIIFFENLFPMPNGEEIERAHDYLELSMGLLLSVQFSVTSNEYQIRNGFSRLYYAFFHVSLALLIARGEDIEVFRKDHGRVQTKIKQHMEKYRHKFIHDLYLARLQADYEPWFFRLKYGENKEKAQAEAVNTLRKLRRTSTGFILRRRNFYNYEYDGIGA